MCTQLAIILGVLVGLWLFAGLSLTGPRRSVDMRTATLVSMVSACVVVLVFVVGQRPMTLPWESSNPGILVLAGTAISGVCLLFKQLAGKSSVTMLSMKLVRTIVVPALILLAAGVSNWHTALTLPDFTPMVTILLALTALIPIAYVAYALRVPTDYLHMIGPRRSLLQLGTSFARHIVVTGLPEEFFYRLFLLGLLSKTIGIYPALVLVSLAFGLAHMSPARSPIGRIGFALAVQGSLGFMLGVVFLATQSLWPCVLMHAAANALFRVKTEAFSRYSGSATRLQARKG